MGSEACVQAAEQRGVLGLNYGSAMHEIKLNGQNSTFWPWYPEKYIEES